MTVILLLVVLYFFATQEHVLFYDKEKMYFKINFKKCEARKISTLKNCTSDHKHSCTDSIHISLFATAARELRI